MIAHLCLWLDAQGDLNMLGPKSFRKEPLPALQPSGFSPIAQSRMGLDAAAILPESVWQHLSAADFEVLLLDQSLPARWHQFPWEQLTHRGQRLAERFQVIRYAHVADTPPSPRHETLCWHQWPGAEFDWLEDCAGVKVVKNLQHIQRSLTSGEDLGRYARLLILAHGGEDHEQRLKTLSGAHWAIQWPSTLPPEVWIMACANYEGNMHELAVACLQRGASRVVCGHGQLNANLISAILQARFADPEQPLAEFLRAQRQANPLNPGGAQCLRYYGHIRLDTYEHMTLAFYQDPQHPNPLNQLLSANAAPVASTFLHEVIADCEQRTPLTARWLLPCALYLAEQHQHELLPVLESRYRQLPPTDSVLPAECAYALASAYRRAGNYPKVIKALSDGLSQVTDPSQQIKLLGALLNNLIDFALPDAAQTLLDELTLLISAADDSEQVFRLMDRRSRLLLRRGNPHGALAAYAEKQQLARLRGENAQRELAGLLYVAAWMRDEEAPVYAQKALALVSALMREAPHGGNDTLAYLLRALAVYQWRFGLASLLSEAVYGLCRQRLKTLQDKGPWASVLIYRELQRGDFAHPDWQVAIGALEKDQYWLELAVFLALAQRPHTAILRSLEQFQRMREMAVSYLQADRPIGVVCTQEVPSRSKSERALLLSPHLDAEVLLPLGLLPV